MKDMRQPWFKDAICGLFVHWGMRYIVLTSQHVSGFRRPPCWRKPFLSS